jgi:hypothetical protein
MVRVSGKLLCALRDARDLPPGVKLIAIFLLVFPGRSTTMLAQSYRSRRSFFRDLAEARALGIVSPDRLQVTIDPIPRRPTFRRSGLSVLLVDDRLSTSAKLVAVMIRLRGDRYDPGLYRETLEGDTGLGPRTVDRALAELRRSGWLVSGDTHPGWELKLLNLRLRVA